MKMSKYASKAHIEGLQIEKELNAIAAALGPDWLLVYPEQLKDAFYRPANVIQNKENYTSFFINTIYTKDRFKITGEYWPSYTDINGKKQRITPDNLHESWPGITAARSRNPAAIARQIQTKFLPVYLTSLERTITYCNECQNYANTAFMARQKLARATGNPDSERGNFYVRNLPGDAVGFEFHSAIDICVNLNITEAIALVDLLWELRGAANPESDSIRRELL